MKTLIGIVLMATMLFITPPKANALFGHTAKERQRRIATQQQLSHEQQRLNAQQQSTVTQQQRANRWQVTAFILGIATIVAFIAGTAIGSKGRHDAAGGN